MSRQLTRRRAFLGGATALLSLPLLDSIVARKARAGGEEKPLRLLTFYTPCGMHMPAWTPSATGSAFDLPTILSPLEAVRDKGSSSRTSRSR